MGLRQGDSSQPDSRSEAPWGAVTGLVLTIIVLGLFGDTGRDWLAFDRTAIPGGDYWRILTAHFVHLGPWHLVLNLAGLLLVAYLVGDALSPGEWAITLAIAAVAVSAGLWLLQPELERYVGLSGVLHGLLAAGLVATIGRWGIDLWIVAVALTAKLVFEQVTGPMPASATLAGGNVIVAAHLYGAVSGCIAGASVAIRVRAQASI